MEGKRKTPLLKSVDKALEILDYIGEVSKPMTASEISKNVRISISSLYKILTTFVEKEYLEYDGSTKLYQLSSKILRFASAMRNERSRSVSQIALPIMLAVADQTKETVHLGIPEGNYGVFLEKVNSPHTVGVQTRIGTRVPFNRGATSKAMMAFLSEERFNRFCSDFLSDGSPESHETVLEAKEQRALIRKAGYVVTFEEVNPNVAAVAAPIFGFDNELVGSMAIAGPCNRFTEDIVETYIPLIREACRKVSKNLGATCFAEN